MTFLAATVLSLVTLAAPAAATPSAGPAPVADLAAPTCVVTPVLPRVVVADVQFVRRTFVLQTTCRLQAPAVFRLTYSRPGYTAGFVLDWAGDHGLVGDGATLVWRAQSDFVAFGAYRLVPVQVHAAGGGPVTVRPAGLSIKALTRSTLVIGRLGSRHIARGAVTTFNGYRTLTAGRPVLLQWRDDNRWVSVRQLQTAGDGRWTTTLPETGPRRYRAVAPALPSATAATSRSARCADADRRSGGC